MTYNFDTIINRKGTYSIKYNGPARGKARPRASGPRTWGRWQQDGS